MQDGTCWAALALFPISDRVERDVNSFGELSLTQPDTAQGFNKSTPDDWKSGTFRVTNVMP